MAALTLPIDPEIVEGQSRYITANVPDPVTELMFDAMVQEAVAYVQGITWRILDPALEPTDANAVMEETPVGLIPIAYRAVRLILEREIATSDSDFVEESAQGRLLRGFTAGPYSESYFAPGEFARRGVQQRPAMDPEPQIDAALWALATEGAREQWIAWVTGIQPPAGVVTSFNARLVPGRYGRQGPVIGTFPGPDGY